MAVFPPPPVNGLGPVGGFKLQLEDRAGLGEAALNDATQALVGRAYQSPQLAGVFSGYRVNVPQLDVEVDRDKVKQEGIVLTDLFQTHAGVSRVGVRERLQQVRPYLSGEGAGGRAVPGHRREHCPAQGAQRAGRHDPARVSDHGEAVARPRSGRPLQRVSVSRHYRIPFMAVIPIAIATPALGIAQAALEDFTAMVGGRTTKGAVAGAGSKMAEFGAWTSPRSGLINAARLLLLRGVDDTGVLECSSTSEISPSRGTSIRGPVTFGTAQQGLQLSDGCKRRDLLAGTARRLHRRRQLAVDDPGNAGRPEPALLRHHHEAA